MIRYYNSVNNARAVTIRPQQCEDTFDLLDWDVKRFGPYVLCLDGTMTFQWKGLHGVFQIPSIACPSNYTSGETTSYKFLAPVSNGGRYEWKVPNVTGHYWITSQSLDDCKNGMLAEIFVVDPNGEPFLASGARNLFLISFWKALLLSSLGNMLLSLERNFNV